MDLTKAEIIEQIGEFQIGVFELIFFPPISPSLIIQGRPVSWVQNQGKIENCQFPKICFGQQAVMGNKKTPKQGGEGDQLKRVQQWSKTGEDDSSDFGEWCFDAICKPVTKFGNWSIRNSVSNAMLWKKIYSFSLFLFVWVFVWEVKGCYGKLEFCTFIHCILGNLPTKMF